MPLQRTLSIIKPDAVEAAKTGEIIARLQAESFAIRAMRQLRLSRQQAEGFYDVHRGRPFFDDLCDFMSRGPVVVMVLEADDAIERYRGVIGSTDPAKAAASTIRKQYGTDVGQNAVHGSDSPENAVKEIAYFFAGHELH